MCPPPKSFKNRKSWWLGGHKKAEFPAFIDLLDVGWDYKTVKEDKDENSYWMLTTRNNWFSKTGDQENSCLQWAQPRVTSSRFPPVLLRRNPRTFNHLPLTNTSDSAYSAWLVKHSLPPYLGKPCSAVFTVGNGDVIFKGNFVNPATHSDSLVDGKATLRTPFCVLFSDKECKRYSTFQATKAVQLFPKIYLIAAISAHISIQDMLGLDSLTPLPQVHASYKETL